MEEKGKTDRWRKLAMKLFVESRRRVEGKQNLAASFFNVWLRDVRKWVYRLPESMNLTEFLAEVEDPVRQRMFPAGPEFKDFLKRTEEGRWVSYKDRVKDYPFDPSSTGTFSQGGMRSMEWRGQPLLKTAFDFALYPVIFHDVQPATILELGSGPGASAQWMADLPIDSKPRIISVDIQPTLLQDSRVEFVQGDCNQIEKVLDQLQLDGSEGPLIVIEDAHVNTAGILASVHELLRPGDYLILEDSGNKQAAMDEFMSRHAECYRVDTAYTDFFGVNQTSAWNSIWKRVGDQDAA